MASITSQYKCEKSYLTKSEYGNKVFRHETSHRKASYVALVTVNGIREGGKKTTTPKNKNKKQLGQLEFYSTLKTEKLLGQFGDFRDLWRSEVLRSMRSQTLKKNEKQKSVLNSKNVKEMESTARRRRRRRRD